MLDKAIHLKEQSNHEEAKVILMKLLKNHPEDKYINFHCAEVCDALGHEREAIPFYRRALESGIDGELRERAFIQLGSSLRSIGEYKEAIEILQKGLKEYPDNNAIQVFMAISLYNIKEEKLSVQTLINCLLASPTDKWIKQYSRALRFYSNNIDEIW